MDRYDDRKAALTGQIADVEQRLDELYTRSQERHAPPVLAVDVDALTTRHDELTNELADLEDDPAWRRHKRGELPDPPHPLDPGRDVQQQEVAVDPVLGQKEPRTMAIQDESERRKEQARTHLREQRARREAADQPQTEPLDGMEVIDWDNGGKEAFERIHAGEDPQTVLADTPTRRLPYRIVEIDDLEDGRQTDQEHQYEDQEVEVITEAELSRVISVDKARDDLQRIINGESARTVLAENFDDPTVLDDRRHDRDSHQRAQRAADQPTVHDTAQETSRDDDLEDDEQPAHHRSRDHAGPSRDLERQL